MACMAIFFNSYFPKNQPNFNLNTYVKGVCLGGETAFNIKYIPVLHKNVKLYKKKIFVHRRPGYGTWNNQKPPSIFQLIDQLENVAEKLIAE
jgi:hypothetical protein